MIINTPANDGTPLSLIYSENEFTELLIDIETGEIITNTLDDIFKIKLNALINDKSAEILSKPSVLVLDGRQARIQVGQQIPISKLPISAFSGDEILIPDIEYLPVGIVLNIKPRISNDLKSVSMQIETIITETEELTSGVLEAPIINNRKVESHVKVLNNTPFIIGGLISNKKADQEGRIPVISKIPLIGKLFTWNTKQSLKKEVIVVITPHIIDNNDDNFSRIIPQDESIFDSFGNTLFPNSYRLKESDIYDLNFITESDYLTGKGFERYLSFLQDSSLPIWNEVKNSIKEFNPNKRSTFNIDYDRVTINIALRLKDYSKDKNNPNFVLLHKISSEFFANSSLIK